MTTETAPLEAGSPAPDLRLVASDGTEVHLSALWEHRPLILAFFGDLANPFSGDHAQQLRDAAGAFNNIGAGLAAIASSGRDKVGALEERWGLPYPVLCDPARDAYSGFQVRGSATFIIDTQGVVRFSRQAANLADYPPTPTLLAACAPLTGAEYVAPNEDAVSIDGEGAIDASLIPFMTVTCPKCECTAWERVDISTSGGAMSRFFDYQGKRFIASSCVKCGYTELYKRKASLLSNVIDILGTG